jgi:probable rRNA maturation factor
MIGLTLCNRQRATRIDCRCLRRIIHALLSDHLRREDVDLGVFLVGEVAMAQLNEEHLGHPGSTDVITFDYNDPDNPKLLAGEIFVCVPVAIKQAREFRTIWQCELVRYIVHGALHLLGFDDRDAVSRRKMKREENRLVKRLAGAFSFKQLGR